MILNIDYIDIKSLTKRSILPSLTLTPLSSEELDTTCLTRLSASLPLLSQSTPHK
jgi:hypothetical protein